MAVACYLGGALLIVAGLVDVFLTVLHYDEPGLIAARSYRGIWRTARAFTSPLPPAPRALLRSMAAPVMVVASLAGWLSSQMLGFALLYWPAVGNRHEFTLGNMHPGFPTALYFSAASMTSLSFSDAEPRTLGYHWAAAAETIVGLAILTLAISYLLGLYQVLQNQSVLAARLQHQSGRTNDPRALLEPHFRRGEPDGLSAMLRDLHENLTNHYEGMRRYPIVYYFHTRAPYRSIPYIFWFIGASAAALRWGLPAGQAGSDDPWLPALLDGFDDVRSKVTERFIPGEQPEDDPGSEPVSFDCFRDARARGRADNERLSTFTDMEAFMRRLARLEEPPDDAESYQRYVDWHRFSYCGKAFVEAASRDLGLEPSELYENPTSRRF